MIFNKSSHYTHPLTNVLAGITRGYCAIAQNRISNT